MTVGDPIGGVGGSEIGDAQCREDRGGSREAARDGALGLAPAEGEREGAGPYKLVSFKPGVELVVEAHEQFWRKTPNIKRLVFKSIPDESTRLAMLKRGEADVS